MCTVKAALTCLFTALSLASAWAEDAAQSARAALDECSSHPQAGMRECMAKKVSASNVALKQAEDQARSALAKWDEDAKYVKLAVARLNASSREFSRYREATCAFEASLGGGAIGSALEVRRMTCILDLNLRRAEQLGSAASELPMK